MYSLLYLVGLLILVFWALHWFRKTPPAQVSERLQQIAVYGMSGLLLLLALIGRLPWFVALAGVFWLVARRQRSFGGWRSMPGQTSSIETASLSMTLDHANSSLDGTVLNGPFNGRVLSTLDLAALLQLLAYCQSDDAESVPLLEAYLDRRFEDWRERSPQPPPASASDAMTLQEAYSILGLADGATVEDVKAAHKRLMQKLHPDRGGSGYLAAKINLAKDYLLKNL